MNGKDSRSFCLEIVFLVTYWTVNWAMATGIFLEFQDQVLRGLLFVGVSITLMTVYLGIWVLFYWTFYHSMKNITYLKNIRWMIIFFVWIAIEAIGHYIHSHPLFEKINSIGTIQIHVLKGISFQVDQDAANITPDIGTSRFFNHKWFAIFSSNNRSLFHFGLAS